jgi:hypothetical protein
MKPNHLVYCLMLMAFFVACDGSSNKPIKREKLSTQMNDDAYVFFRNMRQTYYHIEDLGDAGIRIYRFKKQAELDSSRAMMQIGIMVNWRSNKAYLLLQPSPIVGDSIRLSYLTNEGEQGTWQLNERNQQLLLDFATDMYEGLQKGYAFTLYDSLGNGHPFLDVEQNREAFRICLKDFYRLTRVL